MSFPCILYLLCYSLFFSSEKPFLLCVNVLHSSKPITKSKKQKQNTQHLSIVTCTVLYYTTAYIFPLSAYDTLEGEKGDKSSSVYPASISVPGKQWTLPNVAALRGTAVLLWSYLARNINHFTSHHSNAVQRMAQANHINHYNLTS